MLFRSDGKPSITEPQIASAKLLTEILRARYRIPAHNCVTHAQVSVNASNILNEPQAWYVGYKDRMRRTTINFVTVTVGVNGRF